MIRFVRGKLVATDDHSAVVDVGGIGYEVWMSTQGLQALPPVGSEVTLHTYTHVREDTWQLYGFVRPEARDLFCLLIGVGGVGPRLALQMLGGRPAHVVAQAIAAGDIGELRRLPGVGKRIAERLHVELRDKVGGWMARHGAPETAAAAGDTPRFADLRSALVNLGYRNAEVQPVLDALRRSHPDADFQTLVREALALLRTGQAR